MSTSASKTLPVLVLLALLSGATAMAEDCKICEDMTRVAGTNCWSGMSSQEFTQGMEGGVIDYSKLKEEGRSANFTCPYLTYTQKYTCKEARDTAAGDCAHYEERCCGDHNNNDMVADCEICTEDMTRVAGTNCYTRLPTTAEEWRTLIISDRSGMSPEDECEGEEYPQKYTCEEARKSNCDHYKQRCCGDHNNNDMDQDGLCPASRACQDMDKKCAPCDEDVGRTWEEDDNTIAGVNCYATEDDRTTAYNGGIANVTTSGRPVDYDCKNEGVPDPYTCTGMFNWMQSPTTPFDKGTCDHYHSQCCGRRFCGAGTEWKQAADESRSCVATYEGAMAACKKQRDGTETGGADWSFTCGHVGDTCENKGGVEDDEDRENKGMGAGDGSDGDALGLGRRLETLG